VGAGFASTLFAVALLASGQNSSITGTLGRAGGDGRLYPYEAEAVGAADGHAHAGDHPDDYCGGILRLTRNGKACLLLSQVILSLQLSFAVVPLVKLTGDRKRMGEFANGWLLKGTAWFVAVLIAG